MGRDWNRANLKGQRFGMLTVWLLTDRRIGGHAVWQCRCDCGGWADVTTRNLKSGNTIACGCQQVVRTLTHTGQTGTIVRVDHAKLKAAKIASGLTYEDIEDETGIDAGRIARICLGQNRYVPRAELRRIAKAINADAKSLTLAIVARPKRARKNPKK